MRSRAPPLEAQARRVRGPERAAGGAGGAAASGGSGRSGSCSAAFANRRSSWPTPPVRLLERRRWAHGEERRRGAREGEERGALLARGGGQGRERRGEWEGRGGLVTAAPCPEHPEASRRLESAFYAPLCPHRCYNVSVSSVSRDVIGSWKYVMGARLFVFVFLSLSCLGFWLLKNQPTLPEGCWVS